VTLSTANIAAGIAAISISGLTIKNITAIPEQVQPRDCPIIFPHPVQYIQGGAGGEEGQETFGTPTTRFWLFNRTFRYLMLYTPVGSTRGMVDIYGGFSAKIDAFMEAVAELDVTDVDVRNITVSELGVIEDPAGSKFYGCTIDIMVREKVNQ
jgi:hypothetical protein